MFSPKVAYNASLTAQTFLSLSYQLTLDHFERRPGDKTLDSHQFLVRAAHAFSGTTTLDVVEMFQLSRNPESLLNGIPLNTDQSSQRNEVDGHFSTNLTAKIGLSLKARTVYYNYRNAALGRSLDRIENLFAASANYAIRPEVKAVGEIRHQDISYTHGGSIKDKTSDFIMGGADYELAKKVTTTARFGAEWRHRDAERSTTSPYIELTAKYEYAEGSFLTGGYMYTLEEASDTALFTDTKVNRLFVGMQHAFTPLIVASGTFTYEPSELQGRRGQVNIADDTIRAGVSLSYLPTKNWTISVSYDDDSVTSASKARNLSRERVGLNATYAF